MLIAFDAYRNKYLSTGLAEPYLLSQVATIEGRGAVNNVSKIITLREYNMINFKTQNQI